MRVDFARPSTASMMRVRALVFAEQDFRVRHWEVVRTVSVRVSSRRRDDQPQLRVPRPRKTASGRTLKEERSWPS
jgi:hypothetical protein